eukprot:7999800-Pyramimonas_sp.AAC.1
MRATKSALALLWRRTSHRRTYFCTLTAQTRRKRYAARAWWRRAARCTVSAAQNRCKNSRRARYPRQRAWTTTAAATRRRW